MDNFCLDIPFMVLSTRVNRVGETEKRFLTPFGTIDVTFRKVSNGDNRTLQLEIEVAGDTENWIFHDHTIMEFKCALLHFVWGLSQKYLRDEALLWDLNESCIQIECSHDRGGYAGSIYKESLIFSPVRVNDAKLLDLVVERPGADVQ
ncbi:MAG: hypothetical protein BA872_00650 [Desulfobacterales bacterium C00003060]|nr:MAG: hypothetical protein BA872_00650 [Desulfobacterales bacterium C00003060]